jgi:hypothetical protein
MADLFTRWSNNAPLTSYTRNEAAALADFITENYWDAYSNSKHRDHAWVSSEVQKIRAYAHPGVVTPDGTFGSADPFAAAPETLYR